MTTIVTTDGLTKRYRETTALSGIDLAVPKGTVYGLVGPNGAGKTSIFNRLTGLDLKVTNYPGVTVERQEGHFHLRDGSRATVIDIPGTYSMSGRSAEEQIAIASLRHALGLPIEDIDTSSK